MIKDGEAGNAVVAQYWESTQKKIWKRLLNYEAFRYERDKEATVHGCVNDAFGSFWLNFKPTHFMQAGGRLSKILSYLEKCALSAVGQWARDRKLAPPDDLPDDEAHWMDDKAMGPDVELIEQARACFMRHCADDIDRQLVRRVAIEGMRLETVWVEMRHIFPRRQDMYQRWRTFKERVGRDKDCKQLLTD
jgi:hypothetical protein